MRYWQNAILALVMGSAACGHAAELGVLEPVAVNRQPLMKATPSGKVQAPVVVRITSGALFEQIQREAGSGFTRKILALDELAMQVAGAGKTSWLMLSMEDGGFARKGFWLREGDSERWLDEAFVDLVVDADSVADGSFEEIYAHEMGHVMLHRVLDLPPGYSRTPHHSYSITDQQTALDEGFATHFQAVSRMHTRNERLRAQDMGLESRSYVPLWQSNLDRAYRIDGVRQNWFVHRQVPLPGTGHGAGDGIERHELSTLFDRERLKSAPQMLASEGAVATFFFRWLGPGDGSAEALRMRYEPLFRAWHSMNAAVKLDADSPLLPLTAQTLARQSPDQGRRLVQVLMETSYGALTSPKLAASAEALARIGRTGDSKAFVPALKDARKALAEETAEVQRRPERLAELAGPALWLRHPTLKTGSGFGERAQLTVNLNTAEHEHLLALPGLTGAAVQRALASRRAHGAFRSVADFARRAKLGAAEGRALQAMAAAAEADGPYLRQ